jgi:hypothetical protein
MDLTFLDRCASRLGSGIKNDDAASQQNATMTFNACLADLKAPYRVQWLILRRGPVKC